MHCGPRRDYCSGTSSHCFMKPRPLAVVALGIIIGKVPPGRPTPMRVPCVAWAGPAAIGNEPHGDRKDNPRMTSATTSRRRFLGRGAQSLGFLAWMGSRPDRSFGASVAAQAAAPQPESAAKLIERGIAFLRPRQDAKGGWSTQREPGVTALVVTALLRSGQVTPEDPAVTRALAYLEGFIGPNGGLSEAPHANYTTSIALVAFQEANRNGRYDRTIKAAQNFLKTMQWDETEGKAREDAFYGGAGYGGRNSRPDLSNTAFLIEALRDTGLPADDPNLKKALVFVSRCQNLQRVQRPVLGGQGQRRRVHLHARQRRGEHGRQDGRRRPPLLRQHDLCRAQEHDLCRARPQRPPRQGGADVYHPALHPGREPRPRPARALLLLPHVRQDDGRPRRTDLDRRRGDRPRLEGRADRGPGQAATRRWELGQPG